MSLYAICDQIAQAISKGFEVDEETGEVLADISELESLQIAEEEKLENIICYRKNLLAEADAIKAEETELNKRRKSKEAKANRLDQYIALCMKTSGRNHFESPRCKASFRTSKCVEIDEKAFFGSAPSQYVRVKREADKKAIREALQEGIPVVGASLVEKDGLVIK